MTDQAPLLSVRDLRIQFPGIHGWNEMVRGVSFDLHAGETLSIVGESGSGKSITSLAIMRLLNPKASRVTGSVRLSGRELLDLPPEQMRQVRGQDMGMIFQEPMTSLNPVLKVGTQIAEVLRFHRQLSWKDAGEEAVRLLERVRIPAAKQRFHDYPHRLSGGMRQRAMIAMALACSPRILIADEPTTALDVTIQGQILDLIGALQDEAQMGVIFVTHDMGVVAEISDRTLVMYRGEISESGTTREIFEHPSQPYTRSLIAAVPVLGAMKGKPGPMMYPLIDSATGGMVEPRAAIDPPPAGGKPVLEVQGLGVRFPMTGGILGRVRGSVHAVEDVSFNIGEAETLSLVGESGSGKSTTGRAIVRLVKANSGTIRLGNADVLAQRGEDLRRMRRSVQMIFQDPYASLDPRKSVGRAITDPLVAHGIMGREDAAREAGRLLELVGLRASVAERRPHEFSGGQRQRVCIARALALKPRLLIADEAVSALDVSIKAQVMNLMMELQRELRLSYLFISHDMSAVERISHRVAVMYLGEIVEIGPREAVFETPTHPYTRKLMAAVPVPDFSRKRERRALSNDEIRSPVRPVGYSPPRRIYDQVSPGHLVMREE